MGQVQDELVVLSTNLVLTPKSIVVWLGKFQETQPPPRQHT